MAIEPKVHLALNAYQAVNLRWLLRKALHGPLHGDYDLLTGDWNFEILWALEQLIIDQEWTAIDANRPETWPYTGYHAGEKSPGSELQHIGEGI